MNPGTQYEMKIKAGYKSGCTSPFSPISYFNTLPEWEYVNLLLLLQIQQKQLLIGIYLPLNIVL